MPIAVPEKVVERILAGVSEGSVPKVMRQRDGLNQVLVEAKSAGQDASDLGHFEGVTQPSRVVVPGGRNKHLSLAAQASKGVGMNDAITVALKSSADRGLDLRNRPTGARSATLRVRCEQRVLDGFQATPH